MSISKSVWHWAWYDFANSSYILVFGALLLPVYFAKVLIQQGYALSAWGTANALATIIGVCLAIIIGRYSDKTNKWRLFRGTVICAFLGMILLSFAVKFLPAAVYWLFVLTQAIFILSLSLSDSMLPWLATKNESYAASGFAWGFGYLGGIASLLIVMALQKSLGDEYHPIVFLSTALFFIIFSWYAWRGLKPSFESTVETIPEKTIEQSISPKEKIGLLAGYWLISEGITVVLLFFTIYLGTELHFSAAKIGVVILLAQILAFPATWYGGKLAQKYSILTLLGATIVCWGFTIAAMVLHTGFISLAVFIIAGSLAIGNSQSYLRGQYATLIKRKESGFQYGLYTIVAEASVFVGPVIYGWASDRLNSQKIPLVILYATMVVGYALVYFITKKYTIQQKTD